MQEVLEKLAQLYLWDLDVMSEPQMYYYLLLPIACFLVFFVVKWLFLTLPAWLPVAILIAVFRGDSSKSATRRSKRYLQD